MASATVVDDLGFAWPDGQAVFDGLGFAVGPGRSGLIGANGSGKSTLLRLIAGELVPDRGSVQVTGSLGYLRQDLSLRAGLPVEDVLGIARGAPGAACDRGRRGDRGAVRRRRRRLGRGGARPGRPGWARPRPPGAGPARWRGVGRGGGPARAGRRAPAPPGRAAAGRADQQPRPGRPPPPLRGRARLVRGHGGGEPRPRAAGAGRPGGRAPRRRRARPRSPPASTAALRSSGWRRRGSGWPRPGRRSATTRRSRSTCPRPRSRPAAPFWSSAAPGCAAASGRTWRCAASLSGGERFRATLAALLLAEPAPQLLLLDEPTNSLDLVSAGELAQALAAYRGALLVASHDLPFLRTIGITRWLRLDGRLTELAQAPPS